MSPKLMIWISVTLSAIAQIFLKQGLCKLQENRTSSGIGPMIVAAARQAYVWLWGICFVLATALWLLGLQKLELSYAYPLVAFGYVLVNIMSALFFQESVNRNRWMAVGVIGLGVILIAGS
jgi:multidrug transporter EmrE-like cation transporter